VRKVKAVTFTSTETSTPHAENCIVFLTNLGEVSILAFPDLKRQVTTAAIRKEDVVGISSLVFSEAGLEKTRFKKKSPAQWIFWVFWVFSGFFGFFGFLLFFVFFYIYICSEYFKVHPDFK
jgi:hypothetical protein